MVGGIAGPIGPLVRSKPRGWAIGRVAIIGPSPYRGHRGPLSVRIMHMRPPARVDCIRPKSEAIVLVPHTRTEYITLITCTRSVT